LIPLPEAKDFEGRSNAKRQLSQQRKSSKRLSPEQRDAAKAFIDAIPTGQWTSYKDVAIAATGNPLGAMGQAAQFGASPKKVATSSRHQPPRPSRERMRRAAHAGRSLVGAPTAAAARNVDP